MNRVELQVSPICAPPDPSTPEVAEAQTLLNRLGGTSAVRSDGALDATTGRALMEFQRSEGLLRTGVPDPLTMERLQRRVLERDAPETDQVWIGGHEPGPGLGDVTLAEPFVAQNNLDPVTGPLVAQGRGRPSSPGPRRTLVPPEEPTFAIREGTQPCDMHPIASGGGRAGAAETSTVEKPTGSAVSAVSAPDSDPFSERCAAALQGDLSRAAEALRDRLGIPPARARASGGTLDGWSATAAGMSYRVGMNVIVRGEGRLLVRETLERLASNPAVAARTTEQLARARAFYGRLDPALVVAVATRETRAGAFRAARTGTVVDSYSQGGLDYLADLMRDRTLFARGELAGWSRAPLRTNEQGRPVRPARIPASQQVRAYAAAMEQATRRLEAAIREELGADAATMLRTASVDARRMWTRLAFSAPYGSSYRGPGHTYGPRFGLRTALSWLVATTPDGQVPDLERVLEGDDWLNQFTRIRSARAVTADAALLDGVFDS